MFAHPCSACTTEPSVHFHKADGPGTLSFELGGERGSVVVSGGVAGRREISRNFVGREAERVEVDVDAGLHRLRVSLQGNEESERTFDLSVANAAWEAGWPVELASTIGGSVVGLSEGFSRVAHGARIELEAVPEEGNVFLGWGGDADALEAGRAAGKAA